MIRKLLPPYYTVTAGFIGGLVMAVAMFAASKRPFTPSSEPPTEAAVYAFLAGLLLVATLTRWLSSRSTLLRGLFVAMWTTFIGLVLLRFAAWLLAGAPGLGQ